MPSHVRVVPCQKKRVIEKFVKSVPCTPAKPKKKIREVSCPRMESKRTCNVSDDIVPCSDNKNNCQKRAQKMECPAKQEKSCIKHVEKVPCSGAERKKATKGCPKCEDNRISRLECEVYQLRREIERLKQDRKAAERAVGRAIIRGARALGGRFKPAVPESIEKLLDSCESDASMSTSASVTFCSAKAAPAVTSPCRRGAVKEDFVYCE